MASPQFRWAPLRLPADQTAKAGGRGLCTPLLPACNAQLSTLGPEPLFHRVPVLPLSALASTARDVTCPSCLPLLAPLALPSPRQRAPSSNPRWGAPAPCRPGPLACGVCTHVPSARGAPPAPRPRLPGSFLTSFRLTPSTTPGKPSQGRGTGLACAVTVPASFTSHKHCDIRDRGPSSMEVMVTPARSGHPLLLLLYPTLLSSHKLSSVLGAQQTLAQLIKRINQMEWVPAFKWPGFHLTHRIRAKLTWKAGPLLFLTSGARFWKILLPASSLRLSWPLTEQCSPVQ